MKILPRALRSSLLVTGGLLLSGSAHADLSYTTKMNMGFGGDIATVMSFKGNKRRIESQVFGSKDVTVTTCGSSTPMRIAPDLKIYSVGEAPVSAGQSAAMGNMFGNITAINVHLKDLGTAKISGQNARHWMVDTTMTSTKHQAITVGMEIWSGRTPVPMCPGGQAEALKMIPGMARALVGKVKVTGDTSSLGRATSTVPLQMKMSMNGRAFGTMTTSNISTDTLPAGLFAAPVGFRKVSPQAFDKAKSDAMMQRMKNGGLGGMFGGHGLPHAN